MVEHNPPPTADRARAPLILLPVALYVSNELIFELYDWGQPWRRFSIRWERLVSTKKSEPEPTPQLPQTGCSYSKISARVP